MATSLLKRGEKAIVIFTHGKYFKKNRDGSGSTGHWLIDEKRQATRVVIYNRTHSGNQVYVARRVAVTPSKVPGRFVLQLNDVRYYGSTYFNWLQFSGSRNPVRYFRMPVQTRTGRQGSTAEPHGNNLEQLAFS